ncbi:hypothetical protein Si107_00738 [Streptococcus infantarius subsp. infantarius]|nr:hypothetical protein [Streptococcus infantarius subsp. infantarius]
MKTNGVPKIRFKGFTDDWEQRKLIDYLEVSKEKNKNEVFGKEDVLSVSGDYGIVNQIEFQGRSFAGASVAPYGIVDTGDIVYTKSPLKSNPYGIIKANKGKAGIVSTLYAVYKPLDNVCSDFVQIYFEQDARMNNYMHPLVNKGAKNDMKVSDVNALKGEVCFPSKDEQIKISEHFANLDRLITLHQRKCEQTKELKKFMLQKMFPKKGEKNPEIRFPGFTDDWEQRKFGEMFARRMERNNGEFDNTKWISVARMYYQTPDKVTSNNIDTRTYVMRKGDIAFEGHSNSEFKYGRFVANDIGDGVISELFPIYKHIDKYDLNYWKYAIQLESLMQSKLVKCIEISYTSSNKLDKDSFLKEKIPVASLAEQEKIGEYFSNLDRLITLHQRKCEQLKELKKFMLQNMFPKKG